MTDPIRAALERLHQYAEIFPEHDTDLIVARALAALSADGPAVPEGREPAVVVTDPSDAELLGLDQLEAAWNAQADAANGWDELGLDEIIVWAQRQALARWGHQPAPPAEGEVGELVDLIRQIALAWEPDACLLGNMTAGQLARIADLLAQHHQPPQPVAVSERLPRAEDCDAEGRCWIHMPNIGTAPSWRLVDPREIGPYHTHWLPAHALPLPAGEVQP